MTPTVPELLAQKQLLLERLHEEPRLNEQDEIERLLLNINATLNRLDEEPTKSNTDAALGGAADAGRISRGSCIFSPASWPASPLRFARPGRVRRWATGPHMPPRRGRCHRRTRNEAGKIAKVRRPCATRSG